MTSVNNLSNNDTDSRIFFRRDDLSVYAVLQPSEMRALRQQRKLDVWLREQRELDVTVDPAKMTHDWRDERTPYFTKVRCMRCDRIECGSLALSIISGVPLANSVCPGGTSLNGGVNRV